MPNEANQMNHACQTAGGPFTVRYIELAERAAAQADPHTLALIGFADRPRQVSGETCNFDTALPQLASTPIVEHWHSPEPVQCRVEDDLCIARNSEVMFACLQLPAEDIDTDSQRIYARIFELLRTEDYPHLLRVWNYFPRINAVEHGIERYQAFCVGRYRALKPLGDFEPMLPAASALGSASGPLQVYFLAARQGGTPIENPRQVSAFRYPKQYSPRSPSFSRALFKRWHGASHLYISGTSSIVGHETVHADTLAQLEETLTNIETLIETAHRRHGHPIRHLDELGLLKIYLREANLLEPVKTALDARFGHPDAPQRLYVLADVCRADLRLEIEAMHLGDRG